MSRVLRSRRAERDLIEIWNYVATDDDVAASNLLFKIEEQAAFLAEFPHIGTARPELGRHLRSFVVGNYLIFYRPIDGGIRWVRVLNATRDLNQFFRHRL